MAKLTNKTLSELLATLGFEPRSVTAKNNVVWEHPESECTLILPANKVDESPRPGDVVGVRTQLDIHGHLNEHAFDFFVEQGKLTATSSE
ncbi:MAG: hypothetical protein ABI614_01275 [Planctomycetota bacterium]